MPTITELDLSTGHTTQSYTLARYARINGNTVRARVKRDYYENQSYAHVDVLAADLTWTHLADDAPSNWWALTARPGNGPVAIVTELGETAERLIRLAAEILPPAKP